MAEVNIEVVRKVSDKIKALPLSSHFLTFVDNKDQFPEVGADGVVCYFTAITVQNYGFWIGDEKGYVRPLQGEIGSKKLKGSDLLMALSMKAYREIGPEFFSPENLSDLSFDDFCRWIPEEFGFQDLLARYNLAVDYGRHCVRNNISLDILVERANYSENPLGSFLGQTSAMPGYNADGFFKKNLLLAMILANRPEHFLKIKSDDLKYPIVDYHLMRVALRLGLISLNFAEWNLISKREWVNESFEGSIRQKTFQAIRKIIESSNKSMSEIDFLLWSARRYCPEMTEPDCPKCALNDVCQKKIELFQPVFRTTNY